MLRSGEAVDGCAPVVADSILVERRLGESVAQFLRRAGNALVGEGLPSRGLDLLSRARTAGGPRDSLLAESAEALLVMGRLEQAVAATYASEGEKVSVVLLRQRARVFAAAGLEDESRKALREAENLDPAPARGWEFDRRPSVSWVVSGRDDNEDREVDPAFRHRRELQQGFLPTGNVSDPNSGDTSVFLGRSLSQFLQVDYGAGDRRWRLEATATGWSVTQTSGVDDLPWGVSMGFGARRAWSTSTWTRAGGSWQRSWRGWDRADDDLDASLSTGWSRGAVSASLSHRQVLSHSEVWVPSNASALALAWAPSRGPKWSLSGSLAWSGGRDASLATTVPAKVWRTRGVQQGSRLWNDDLHPPSWTLLDPATGVPCDSARMVRFGLGLSRVPEPAEVDVALEERRTATYWTPAISWGLSQALPWRLRASVGVATGWRLWSRSEKILLADPWTPLASSGSLVLARDEESGKLFLVTDPKGGTFVTLDETRRRRDHWNTLALTLSWTPLPWTSWQIGWRATETATNIADIDSTVAPRRSTWSVDGSFWW